MLKNIWLDSFNKLLNSISIIWSEFSGLFDVASAEQGVWSCNLKQIIYGLLSCVIKQYRSCAHVSMDGKKGKNHIKSMSELIAAEKTFLFDPSSNSLKCDEYEYYNILSSLELSSLPKSLDSSSYIEFLWLFFFIRHIMIMTRMTANTATAAHSNIHTKMFCESTTREITLHDIPIILAYMEEMSLDGHNWM